MESTVSYSLVLELSRYLINGLKLSFLPNQFVVTQLSNSVPQIHDSHVFLGLDIIPPRHVCTPDLQTAEFVKEHGHAFKARVLS